MVRKSPTEIIDHLVVCLSDFTTELPTVPELTKLQTFAGLPCSVVFQTKLIRLI